jgi:alkylated DNA repair dioxygenase AlkB
MTAEPLLRPRRLRRFSNHCGVRWQHFSIARRNPSARSSSTKYRPGAGIGWHRDKAQFDEVVGVSLLHPCVLRFRRKAGETWNRASLTVEPRSAYPLSGPARTVWEHSIRALDRLRYSVTFRTLVANPRVAAASDEARE